MNKKCRQLDADGREWYKLKAICVLCKLQLFVKAELLPQTTKTPGVTSTGRGVERVASTPPHTVISQKKLLFYYNSSASLNKGAEQKLCL